MLTRRPFLHGYAVVALFSLFAGEALRNTLSWYGFAVWDAAVLLVSIAVFVGLLRERASQGGVSRRPLRGLVKPRAGAVAPALALGLFVVWCALSLGWTHYLPATLLAVFAVVTTMFAGLTILLALGWEGFLRALSIALVAILAMSLLFELFVSLIVRHPVLPVFPINVVPGEKVPDAFYWSRALLFEGGRIQGILGNANLLGFVALLALIVVGCQIASRTVTRRYGYGALALAALIYSLSQSSTVTVATAVTVVVLVLMLLAHQRRRPALIGVGTLLVLGVIGAVAAYPFLLTLLGKSEDLTGRLDIWSIVAGLFVQHPVLGWGWTSYWQPWVEPFSHLATRNGVVYLQAHNAYLDVAFQLGIIGLAIFVAFLASTGVAVGRRGVISPTWFRDAGVAGSSITGVGGAGSSIAEGSAVAGSAAASWVLGKVLPGLLLAALLTQALAESRLLVEGNWALLVVIALSASGAGKLTGR
jgi:exopolysaccharide production protein ExoQ